MELCQNQHHFGDNQLKAKCTLTLDGCLGLQHQDNALGHKTSTIGRLLAYLHL
jgi:hypothetical protein